MEDAKLARAFAALGHPTRLALFRRLILMGPAGAGPTALADDVGLQRTLVAHHLRPLSAAGLVGSEKRGRDVIYSVDVHMLARVALALQSVALHRP